jgi:uncharacterized protein (PEP-CTERM system associated)
LTLASAVGAQALPDTPSAMSPASYGTGASAGSPAAHASASTAPASSSEQQRRGGWQIVPSIGVRGTLTDNVDQAPSGQAHSDFITEIIPGILIDGQGARVKLHLDYRMDNLIYARDSNRNNLQNNLDAFGTLEAIENFFFIDARAAIDQEAISPFGARPSNPTTVNDNRTETRTYQVSPYLRGRFGDVADYLLRYDYNDLTNKSDSAGDSQVSVLTARVNGTTRLSALTWTAEAIGQRADYSQSRDTEDDRARGIITYAFDPQFRVSATGGYERNDYITLEKTGNSTYGGGFDWAPTPRTRLHGDWERRFFGSGWNYTFSHHLPHLSIALSDVRDVTTDAQNRVGSPGYTAAYDLLFAALASSVPDPIDRASQVQQILNGGTIPPGLGLPADFVVGSPYVERRQQASVALLGVRNTLTLSVYKSTRDILGLGEDAVLPPGFTPNTREWGTGAVFSHRLTAFTSLNASATWRETTATSGPEFTSRQLDTRLGVGTRFSRHTTGSLEYRYTRFEGDASGASDYRENSLAAYLLYQF